MVNAQLVCIEKGFSRCYDLFRRVALLHLHGNMAEGWQGRFLSRDEHEMLGVVSLVFGRKAGQNALQVKDLEPWTSATLGAGAGGCCANSWLVRPFLLHLIQMLRVLLFIAHIKKKENLLYNLQITLLLYSLLIGIITVVSMQVL